MAKKTSQQKLTSNRRLLAREAEKKLSRPIKAVSDAIGNTNDVADIFYGYKVHGGTLTDGKGRTWQLQIYGVIAKKSFIKNDKIVPIFSKWAVGVRVKAFIKYLIDEIFS